MKVLMSGIQECDMIGLDVTNKIALDGQYARNIKNVKY